jgi:hypothetical protein
MAGKHDQSTHGHDGSSGKFTIVSPEDRLKEAAARMSTGVLSPALEKVYRQRFAEETHYRQDNASFTMNKKGTQLNDEQIGKLLDSTNRAWDKMPTQNKFDSSGKPLPVHVDLATNYDGPNGSAASVVLGSRTISLNPNQKMLDTVFDPEPMEAKFFSKKHSQIDYLINHEFGHIVDKHQFINVDSRESFWNANKKSSFMSSYGKKNVFEGYAEVYQYWSLGESNALSEAYAAEYGWDK